MRKYRPEQINNLIKAISFVVITITFFLIFGLCGSIETGAELTIWLFVKIGILLLIGIVSCVAFNLEIKEDESWTK